MCLTQRERRLPAAAGNEPSGGGCLAGAVVDRQSLPPIMAWGEDGLWENGIISHRRTLEVPLLLMRVRGQR